MLIIDYLENEKKKISEMISNKRKEGYDTYLPELLSSFMNSQIMLVNATKKKEDYDNFMRLIKEIKKELCLCQFIAYY